MNSESTTQPRPSTAPILCGRHPTDERIQIGLDEAGRGPLFGRVYTAAVALPDPRRPARVPFDFSRIKDSKRFHSKKRLAEVAEYIKSNALSWSVTWRDADVIDRDNILQTTVNSMHEAATRAIRAAIEAGASGAVGDPVRFADVCLLVDGNYFQPLTLFEREVPDGDRSFHSIRHILVPKGDDTYASIAAASILAKCARDAYVERLCDVHPELDERYGIRGNKGYGARRHLDGIVEHGITQWHRRSFAPCRGPRLNPLIVDEEIKQK